MKELPRMGRAVSEEEQCFQRSKPFRILHVIEGEGGGAATHVLALTREFGRRGIPCLVAFWDAGSSISVAEEGRLDYQVVPKRYSLDPMPIWRIARLIAKKKVNVVHTHTIRGNFYGRLASILSAGSPTQITTVHSHVLDELRGGRHFGLKERLLSIREWSLWPLVDQFICVSAKIRERLLSSGVTAERARVVENAVEVPESSWLRACRKAVREEFNISADDLIVGTIGRLVPLKNHELFIDLAERLAEEVPQVRWFIVGDGPQRGVLMKRVRERRLSRVVEFTGWRQDVLRLMSAFDVYVICSVVEGLNLSVLEAMACGKPVVGTDVKGVSEIVIDQKTGLLVPSQDVVSLADAVLSLLRDKRKRQVMGANGKQEVSKKYSMDQMVCDTLKIYLNASAEVKC